MPAIKKVTLFVTTSVILFCIFSFLAYSCNIKFLSFSNVNLLSDIFFKTDSSEHQVATVDSSKMNVLPDSIKISGTKNFSNYKFSTLITSFQEDTTLPSLLHLDAKLLALKQGKKTKIRIAYLGDSMIEGDRLTKKLRELLQALFGGNGVGFVPVTSNVARFRTTTSDDYSGNWKEINFKNSPADAKKTLFFSGRTYFSNDSWTIIRDRTINDSVLIEKSLICGPTAGSHIQYNDQNLTVHAPDKINRIVLSNDYSTQAKLVINDGALPLYGISFEAPSGVYVDNFSFRGITGIEFNSLDTSFLKAINQKNPYDVIVLGYGVNLLYKPNEKNFTWYRELFNPVLGKLKKCFPNSDIIIVSTADRAFRYNGEYKSAIGIDSVVRLQARLAFKNGLCFYNQFATMGGANSIVKWAEETPALANKDYIHPNERGAKILATHFFHAILNDYNKYLAATSDTSKTN